MEYQTRQWLEEALFDLLATRKSLQNISIAELSEHAQIARRTFYRYYHSKEEVLSQYTEPLKILQDARLQALVLQRWYDKLPAVYTSIKAPWHITNSTQRQINYDSRFIIGGLYNVFDEWLKTDSQTMPIDELVTTTLNTIKRVKGS